MEPTLEIHSDLAALVFVLHESRSLFFANDPECWALIENKDVQAIMDELRSNSAKETK